MNSDKSDETAKLLAEEVAKVLESITPQQRDLLQVKFGLTLSENPSPEELVEPLSKITLEKIESIEREALKKLRDKGAPDGSK